MISCIFVFYLALSSGLSSLTIVPFQAPLPPASGDPDALYANRADLASARRAEAIWAEQLQKNARAFDAAWKLSRTRYWLGGHGPEAGRRVSLEGGIEAGRLAISLEPGRPEGHFWMAANMGALAESYGLRQGLKYRGDIKKEMLTVLALDPAFQQGSADRALGRWYFKVPGMFGGSKTRSEEHLRQSLKYGAQNTASHFFLAETLLDQDRRADARAELQRVIDAPIDPDWAPEDNEFKAKAKQLLGTIK